MGTTPVWLEISVKSHTRRVIGGRPNERVTQISSVERLPIVGDRLSRCPRCAVACVGNGPIQIAPAAKTTLSQALLRKRAEYLAGQDVTQRRICVGLKLTMRSSNPQQ
jgi:hypothetical protein